MGNASTGRRGELHAAAYLTQQHYRIVEQNWRCKWGEIDIIARDSLDTLVFVEVRTRTADTETAFASITPRKRERMIRAAHAYLDAYQLDSVAWRIDVIAVGNPFSASPPIEHAQDALDWS